MQQFEHPIFMWDGKSTLKYKLDGRTLNWRNTLVSQRFEILSIAESDQAQPSRNLSPSQDFWTRHLPEASRSQEGGLCYLLTDIKLTVC